MKLHTSRKAAMNYAGLAESYNIRTYRSAVGNFGFPERLIRNMCDKKITEIRVNFKNMRHVFQKKTIRSAHGLTVTSV